MKAQPDKKSIKDLVDLYKHEMLKANPEYQARCCLNISQRRNNRFSYGYPLPLIYLHHINRVVAGIPSERFK
jgi:hypothetical protein